jgi:AbrB family looped-hinge helix DNA binding protein
MSAGVHSWRDKSTTAPKEESMSQATLKIGRNHRITLPASIREELNLRAGDQLAVKVRDGMIVLVPLGRDAVEQLKGLHREIWHGDVDAYY